MASKALVGVGIGCSVIVLVGVAAVVGTGLWVKNKVGGKLGGAIEASKALRAQQERANELDKKYPFEPPKADAPLALDEKRLEEYLEVRASVAPVFKAFEAKSKQFEKEHKGQPESVGGALEAFGMLTQLYKDVRAKWYEQLELHRMSPREYGAITGTVYATRMGKTMSDMQRTTRPSMEQGASVTEKARTDPRLSPEQKQMMEQTADGLKKVVAVTPDPASAEPHAKIWDANAALLDKHEAEIEKLASQPLDMFLGSAESVEGMEKAFRSLGSSVPKLAK